MINKEDLLRYGEVLEDDSYEQNFNSRTGEFTKDLHFYRIRIVQYEGRKYFHKMMDGEVVECKELK